MWKHRECHNRKYVIFIYYWEVLCLVANFYSRSKFDLHFFLSNGFSTVQKIYIEHHIRKLRECHNRKYVIFVYFWYVFASGGNCTLDASSL